MESLPIYGLAMKVTVVGTGYVGLVTGACLSEMGNHVLCLDVDPKKIRILLDGGLPIYEPGLLEMVRRNADAGRLQFTTDVEKAVAHGTIQFLAVGTPQDEDGSADLQYVLAAARSIGRTMTDHKIIVDKSTVPVGTGDKVKAVIREELAKRGVDMHFSIVSNPEFLKEGSAVNDFMRPDRVVIGADDEQALLLMRALYAPFISNRDRMMVMDVRSAEFTKYAANAMLATRISFMNELSLVAEKVGADIDLVRRGMGSDPRIGSQFLYAGCGYGGSCFPKELLTAVESVNARQKLVLVDKIVARYGEDLSGKTFAMWGLAFKPNTDDMRDAPSRVVIGELVKRGARVNAYDPVAAGEAARVMPGLKGLGYAGSAVEALEGADALVIVTEWKEFRTPDFPEIRDALRDRIVFDGRNLYDPDVMQSFDIDYRAIGRGRPLAAPESVILAGER